MNNQKIKLLSFFSGIGAFEEALFNLNIDYELVGFSEINPHSIKSYCKLHNVSESYNLGDITKINMSNLPIADIITHGSPCTDFSLSGKGKGGDKGSNTRSSLMWHTLDAIKNVMPKVVLWENVKNVLSYKHIHNFNKYIDELNKLGYTSYYKILNSKHFNVPQNRERIFVISVLGEHENFEFPKEVLTNKCINDVLEPIVDKKYYLSDKAFNLYLDNKKIGIMNASSNRKSQAGKVFSSDGISPTLCAGTHGYANGYVEIKKGDNIYVRKFTPKECGLLMGFSEKRLNKILELNTSDTQLYYQFGNSIVVPVLEGIFKEIMKSCFY